MSTEEKAFELRNLGNEAFKKKDFITAIKYFSEGIVLEPDNAVLLSNRSACHCSLKNYRDALSDANHCIEAKRTWAKGYSRKGDALWGLNRLQEAKLAYEEAGIFGDANLYKDKITTIKNMMSGGGGSNPQKQMIDLVLHGSFLLCMIVFAIPFVGIPSFYYHGLKLVVVQILSYIYFTHGIPKFNQEYLRLILTDYRSLYIMSAIAFHITIPAHLYVIPFVIRSVLVLRNDPRVEPFLIKAMQGRQFTRELVYQMESTAGVMEVLSGFMIVVMIFMGGNMISAMFYWQYLRLKYMIRDPHVISAFSMIRMQLDRVVAHPSCPGMVGNAYRKVLGYLAGMVDVQAQQQAAQGGLMSKCNIL